MEKIFRKQIPSTHTMRCFEVSSRYLSFTKAAEELNLTQSAISKQVALLEEMLEIELFIRDRQRLQISEAGMIYLKRVKEILNLIEESSRQMLSYGDFDEIINIASHHTFCVNWLIPALKGFTQANGNIQLRFHDYLDPFDVQNSEIDIAFLYGDGKWQEYETIKLFDDVMVPLTTPRMKEKYSNESDEAIYFDNQLIQCVTRMNMWDHFFKHYEIDNPYSYRGPVFETWSACLAAAREECGIAFVPKFLATEYLERGELVLLDGRSLQDIGAHYMGYLKDHQSKPKVQRMEEWILRYLEKK